MNMKFRRILFLLWFLLGYYFHNFLSLLSVKSFNSKTNNEEPSQSLFLVIFVLSSVKNTERRLVIRNTWAKEQNEDSKVYFVINGGSLKGRDIGLISSEQDAFHDLLIFPGIEDSLNSLTLTVLSSMLWVTGRSQSLENISYSNIQRPFIDFSYILKCDDDSYVRIKHILRELQTTHKGSGMLYWGFFDGRARVKKTGKYKELGWNICDNYLPYALGGGYLLARKPIEFIASNAAFLRLYQNEDTSVGAWLANLKGLIYHHDPRFDTEYLSRGCHQSYLVTHKHSAEAMRAIHDHLLTTGSLCPKEYRTRLSYKYNWNTLPSKCCLRNNPATP